LSFGFKRVVNIGIGNRKGNKEGANRYRRGGPSHTIIAMGACRCLRR